MRSFPRLCVSSSDAHSGQVLWIRAGVAAAQKEGASLRLKSATYHHGKVEWWWHHGGFSTTKMTWRCCGLVVLNFLYLPIHVVALLFIFFPHNVHFSFFPLAC
ncbi:hypothetical protein AAZX31_05G030300 [Glycine max]